MPLAAVSDILFLSDEFWGHSTLNSLRMLVSTCKGFRVDLQGSAKKKSGNSAPLIEHAVRVIVQRWSQDNGGEWLLRFSDAKFRFSLQVDAMAKFCAALPGDDECHLSVDEVKRCKAGYFTAYIRFLDAYKLASKNGLRAAMERRDLFVKKVLRSARESLAFHQPSNQMRSNLHAALKELEGNLARLRNDHGIDPKDKKSRKRISGETELLRDIRLVKQLYADVNSATCEGLFIRSKLAVRDNKVDIPRLERRVADYRSAGKTLVARYRAHSVRCPGKMTLDCLDRLE